MRERFLINIGKGEEGGEGTEQGGQCTVSLNSRILLGNAGMTWMMMKSLGIVSCESNNMARKAGIETLLCFATRKR